MSLNILMVEDDNSVAEMMGMFFKKKVGNKILLLTVSKPSTCLEKMQISMI